GTMRTVNVGEQDYCDLLNEVRLLREQNTELQTRMTELVLQRREETPLRAQVTAFHKLIGSPVLDVPTEYIPEKNVRLRASLIAEEFFETLEAMFLRPATARILLRAKEHGATLIETEAVAV